MKRLLLILILTFSFQSLSKADDIRDFEIEGMSIGDSLLINMSKNEIDSTKKYFETTKHGIKKEYSKIYITKDLNQYDYVAVYFKSNDKNYIIQSIAGRIEFKDNIEECYELQKAIVNDIRKIAVEAKEWSATRNLSGYKGKQSAFNFDYNNESGISVSCYDYDDEKRIDRISVFVSSSDYSDFQFNRAYK